MEQDQTRTVDYAFDKARFDYCSEIYKMEDEKQQALEKKSQFYLSFITLFLGAVFINSDFLLTLPNMILKVGANAILLGTVYGSLVFLLIGIIVSIFSILQSMRVREHVNFYPEKITEALFSPGSDYLEDQRMDKLFRSNAMSYALAIEAKKRVNDRKANWLQLAAISVLIFVISLVILLIVFFYVILV